MTIIVGPFAGCISITPTTSVLALSMRIGMNRWKSSKSWMTFTILRNN
jgi:hypothetical protein